MTDTGIGDGFAQTRGTDELFDDEIVPVSTAEQQSHAQQIMQSSGDGKGHDDEKMDIDSEEPAKQTKAGHDDSREGNREGDIPNSGENWEGGSPTSPTSPMLQSSWIPDRNEPPPREYEPEPEPEPESARVPSVRGDRSATGGVRKVCSSSSSFPCSS